MSNSINVKCKVNSNVEGTEVYALGIANNEYNVKEATNIQAFRTFVITNKGIDGIVKLTSNVTGQDVHQGKGEEEFQGTLAHCFANVDTSTRGAAVVVQDDYINYIYSLAQDGLNRSLWDISMVTKKFVGLTGPANATNFPGHGTVLTATLNTPEPTSPGKYVTITNTHTGNSWFGIVLNQFLIKNVPGKQYTFEMGGSLSSIEYWGFGFAPTNHSFDASHTPYDINVFRDNRGFESPNAKMFPNQSLFYVKVTVPTTLGDLNIEIHSSDNYDATSLVSSFKNSGSGYDNVWTGFTDPPSNASSSIDWKLAVIINNTGDSMYVGNLQEV